MKIYYWSPFFTNIATIKAVIKSAEAITKFSKKKVEVALIDSIGEWDSCKNLIKPQIDILKLNKVKLINYLPKNSFVILATGHLNEEIFKYVTRGPS